MGSELEYWAMPLPTGSLRARVLPENKEAVNLCWHNKDGALEGAATLTVHDMHAIAELYKMMKAEGEIK